MERRLHHHNGIFLHNIMLQGLYKLNDVNYISTHSIEYMWFIYTFSNGEQNNSKAGSQNDKRKENKKSSKPEMCTTKCEDDLIDDPGNYSSSFLTRHRGITTIIMNVFYIIYLLSNWLIIQMACNSYWLKVKVGRFCSNLQT